MKSLEEWVPFIGSTVFVVHNKYGGTDVNRPLGLQVSESVLLCVGLRTRGKDGVLSEDFKRFLKVQIKGKTYGSIIQTRHCFTDLEEALQYAKEIMEGNA